MNLFRSFALVSMLALIGSIVTPPLLISTPAAAATKNKVAKKTSLAFKKCGEFMYHKGGKCVDARDKA